MSPWYRKLLFWDGGRKAPLPTEDWEAAGYVEQRKGLKWRRRYCVLSGGNLYLSKDSDTQATVLESPRVVDVTLKRPEATCLDRLFGEPRQKLPVALFDVRDENGMERKLRVKSEEEAGYWIRYLCQFTDKLSRLTRESPHPSPFSKEQTLLRSPSEHFTQPPPAPRFSPVAVGGSSRFSRPPPPRRSACGAAKLDPAADAATRARCMAELLEKRNRELEEDSPPPSPTTPDTTPRSRPLPSSPRHHLRHHLTQQRDRSAPLLPLPPPLHPPPISEEEEKEERDKEEPSLAFLDSSEPPMRPAPQPPSKPPSAGLQEERQKQSQEVPLWSRRTVNVKKNLEPSPHETMEQNVEILEEVTARLSPSHRPKEERKTERENCPEATKLGDRARTPSWKEQKSAEAATQAQNQYQTGESTTNQREGATSIRAPFYPNPYTKVYGTVQFRPVPPPVAQRGGPPASRLNAVLSPQSEWEERRRRETMKESSPRGDPSSPSTAPLPPHCWPQGGTDSIDCVLCRTSEERTLASPRSRFSSLLPPSRPPSQRKVDPEFRRQLEALYGQSSSHSSY